VDNWHSRNLDPFGVTICRIQAQVSQRLWVTAKTLPHLQ